MSLIFPTMILSYYLFRSSLASCFSLDHRKVNLATIIAPTITAQTQRGGLSTLAFISSKGIYALALKLSPTRQPDTVCSSSGASPELATILFCFFIHRGQTSLLVLFSDRIHCLAFNINQPQTAG